MSIEKEYAELLRRHVAEDTIIADLGLFSRRMRLSRTLGHWEIYKKIALLPGSVIEVGVFRGETLLNWAKLMEIINPGDRTKMVYGFDHWQGLQNFAEQDGPTYDNVGNIEGGWDPGDYKATLQSLADLFTRDSFIPAKSRIQLIDGDIRDTAKQFVDENPGVRLSLLHLDCDLYEPTLAALEAFYPLVVVGGIVLFDEYGIREWPGESAAVDEYFQGNPPTMEKFGWLSTPGGWFVKQ